MRNSSSPSKHMAICNCNSTAYARSRSLPDRAPPLTCILFVWDVLHACAGQRLSKLEPRESVWRYLAWRYPLAGSRPSLTCSLNDFIDRKTANHNNAVPRSGQHARILPMRYSLYLVNLHDPFSGESTVNNQTSQLQNRFLVIRTPRRLK